MVMVLSSMVLFFLNRRTKKNSQSTFHWFTFIRTSIYICLFVLPCGFFRVVKLWSTLKWRPIAGYYCWSWSEYTEWGKLIGSGIFKACFFYQPYEIKYMVITVFPMLFRPFNLARVVLTRLCLGLFRIQLLFTQTASLLDHPTNDFPIQPPSSTS